MKTKAEYQIEWVKSGAYKTVPFQVWYGRQVSKLIQSWMVKAA